MQVTRELVYYMDRLLVSTVDDLVPETPLGSGPMHHQSNHHSSQSCANLMPIQCQYHINPSPIRCRSSADPSQSCAKSPQPGRRQFIHNPVPIQDKSISNRFAIDSQFIPNLMSVHEQSPNWFAIIYTRMDNILITKHPYQ